MRPIGSNCSYETEMADRFSHHFVLCKAVRRLRFHYSCNFSWSAPLRESTFVLRLQAEIQTFILSSFSVVWDQVI